MFLRIILSISLVISISFTTNLKETYYIHGNDINISTIIPNINHDITLFEIPQNRYSLRVKSRLLLKKLNKFGHQKYSSTDNYITFKIKSPINTSRIEEEIINFYRKNYHIINIETIEVQPRGYIDKLPDDYTVHIRDRNFLYNNAIVSIKTLKNKKIFFDYTLKAELPIYLTNQDLKKDTPLSELNTIKKSIILNKFRAKPVQDLSNGMLQTKRNISKNKTLTYRDVEELSAVQKGANINIVFKNNGFNISFAARAIQEGKMGQIITVKKNNGKRFKVKVIGKNKAEMQ